MVFDEASGTLRDVDVTVTTSDGGVRGFAGFEVKRWVKKLDVSHVEALATKLNDMPGITQRAIVEPCHESRFCTQGRGQVSYATLGAKFRRGPARTAG